MQRGAGEGMGWETRGGRREVQRAPSLAPG